MSHDPLNFTKVLTCALPFSLNLPTGGYPVKVDSRTIPLSVEQDFCALIKNSQLIGFFPKNARLDKNSFDTAIPLHTIIRYKDSVVIPYEDLSKVGESEIKNILQSEEISKRIPNIQNGFEDGELDRIANEKFSQLDDAQRQYYARISIAQRNAPPPEIQDFFIKCVNYLIKSYMAHFQDHFAHEISINQLAFNDFIPGVQCLVVDATNGEILDRVNRIEQCTPILRGEWWKHAEDKTQRFKSAIALGQECDSVVILQVRAWNFLTVGAFRSAIIEASAALETCVARKIRKHMLAVGESEPAISTFLTQEYNWRFEERAKKMLKEKTGVSAADIDPVLWQAVQDRRKNYRDKIAHSDKEPDEQDAKDTVKIFIALIDLINKNIPDPP